MHATTVPLTNPQLSSALPTTPLLTRQDVAHHLSSCLRTVDEAIASGQIEIVKIGRSVRIRPSALERFIDFRTQPVGRKKLATGGKTMSTNRRTAR